MMRVYIRGTDALFANAEKLAEVRKALPGQIGRAVSDFALSAIRTSKEKYLTGPRPEKLGVVTGRLRSSIRAKVEARPDRIVAKFGTDVPYAAIHEFGGTTPPRTILPRKAGVLSWVSGGKRFFASKVNHPGGKVRARPFLRPAIEENIKPLEGKILQLLNFYEQPT